MLRLAAPECPLVAEVGDFDVRLAESVTRFYGDEAPADAAPVVVDDARPSLVVPSPSRLRLALPAATRRRTLTAGVRRRDAGDDGPLRAEAFWEDEGGLRSLAAVELPPGDDAWREVAVGLPETAGTLFLVVRDPRPGLANRDGGGACWGEPVIAAAAEPRAQPTGRPDVVLVTVDTLRADALRDMPYLRGRLEEGLRLEAAFAPSPWTLPSYGALFTGRDAEEQGAGRGPFTPEPRPGFERRDLRALGPWPTVAERLRDAGWATAAFHQNPFLDGWSGLHRGFGRWVRTHDDPKALAEPALAWWRSRAGRPRFLVLHWLTPHLPYGPEDEGDPLALLPWRDFVREDHTAAERAAFFDLPADQRAEVVARYRAECTRVDAALAELLPALEADGGEVVLLVHADHGEELWDEGSFEHGHSFADAVLRVPLGIVWPGRVAPAVVAEPAPAHHLLLHALDLLVSAGALPASARDDLPACGLLPDCPGAGPILRARLPYYRNPLDGVDLGRDGTRVELPFTGRGASGPPARVPAEVGRRLEELGYSD